MKQMRIVNRGNRTEFFSEGWNNQEKQYEYLLQLYHLLNCGYETRPS